MIFILLTKVVILYVQIIIVEIGVLKLEKLVRIIPKAGWMVPELFNASFY